MSMKNTSIAILLALLVAVSTGGAAGCEPSTSPAFFHGGDPIGPSYIAADPCPRECPLGAVYWVYDETNGIDGLQRADENRDDTCGGLIEADTFVARAG